jgi:pilus assembly protein Flp/PilA
MQQLYLRVRNWLTREEGQDLAEYALLIGLIALVVLLAVTLLGNNLSTLFSTIASEVGTWFSG